MERQKNKFLKHFGGFGIFVLKKARDNMARIFRFSGYFVDNDKSPYEMFMGEVNKKKYPDAKQIYRFESLTDVLVL